MMKKSKKLYAGIAAVVTIVAIAGGWFLLGSGAFGSDQMLRANFYRRGELIGTSASIVGGHEDVDQMDFTVRVTNTGSLSLSCMITSASPAPLAFSGTKSVPVGGYAEWQSNKISPAPYEGKTQAFSVVSKCDYTYGGQSYTLSKSGLVAIKIDPDPVAGYDMTITSSTGQSGGGADPVTTTTTVGPGTTTTVYPTCFTDGTAVEPYQKGPDPNSVSGVKCTTATPNQYLAFADDRCCGGYSYPISGNWCQCSAQFW